MEKTINRTRDTRTGRFVKDGTEKRRPATTVRTRMRRRRK